MPTIIMAEGGVPVSDYETLQSQYNSLSSEYSSYKSSHSHTNDEYASYGSTQYVAGKNDTLSGSPTSISFSYEGTSRQKYNVSAPLIVLGHSTAAINIASYGYGFVALLGLAKNGSGWKTVKSGNFFGSIDCSGYAALAIQGGGYEPGYGASGGGTISV